MAPTEVRVRIARNMLVAMILAALAAGAGSVWVTSASAFMVAQSQISGYDSDNMIGGAIVYDAFLFVLSLPCLVLTVGQIVCAVGLWRGSRRAAVVMAAISGVLLMFDLVAGWLMRASILGGAAGLPNANLIFGASSAVCIAAIALPLVALRTTRHPR